MSVNSIVRKLARFQSICLLLAVAHAAQPSPYARKEFRSSHGRLRYRMYSPPVTNAKYPLVIWLHDILGIGNNNRGQISGPNSPAATVWIASETQAKHPSFVVAPQCPIGSIWVNAVTRKPSVALRRVPELIDQLLREYPIDPDRIYLVGQSMGGYAVWSLLENEPDRYAAGVPVSGGGDPRKAAEFASIPVWVFHGRRDLLVPVGESRAMVRALEAAGGLPRYTENPKLGHSLKYWKTVFSNPELPDWLFSQSRKK